MRAAAAGGGEAAGRGAAPAVPEEHCWYCAAVRGEQWYYDGEPGTAGGYRRWCAMCNIARRRGDVMADEAARPAVVAGACMAAGCAGCVLAALPARAEAARRSAAKRRQKKGNGKKKAFTFFKNGARARARRCVK